MNRKRNWFVKFLCINLSLCMAVPSMPFMQESAGYVYAAESETQVQDTDSADKKVTQMSENEKNETQEKMTQVSEKPETAESIQVSETTESTQVVEEPETGETKAAETNESSETAETKATETLETSETKPTETPETEAAKPSETKPSETEITETESTETLETEATESSDTETTESETQLEESETNQENDDTEYLNSLLQKLKEKYSNMYINEDGYFAYMDENGTLHTYDPYDPELYKNLLENNDTYEEDDNGFNQFNADSSGTTVSPFTKKTYTHEDHVSNKIVRHGIDVSKYQGEINWEKAKKAGVYFAFIRVGYRGYSDSGTIAGDEFAKNNIKKAHDAGVKVGIYFFSQAITEPEASEEAEFVLNF